MFRYYYYKVDTPYTVYGPNMLQPLTEGSDITEEISTHLEVKTPQTPRD